MVEGAALEKQYAGDCIEGSNPSLSAICLYPNGRYEKHLYYAVLILYTAILKLFAWELRVFY